MRCDCFSENDCNDLSSVVHMQWWTVYEVDYFSSICTLSEDFYFGKLLLLLHFIPKHNIVLYHLHIYSSKIEKEDFFIYNFIGLLF